jgi:hypothetical protein
MGDVDSGGSAEIPVPPQPARMSLAQMKAAKQQKKQRLTRALRSGDAMTTSHDFMRSAPGRTTSNTTTGGGGEPSSTPVRRTRSVTFSQDTLSRPETTAEASMFSDPGMTAPGEPESSEGSAAAEQRVFNSRGELQVDSDDDDDDDVYADGETQSALRASNSIVAPQVPRGAIQKSMVLGGFDGHPAVASLSRSSSADAPVVSTTSSLDSPLDAEAADEVGLVQADWMAVSDSRYAQRGDIQRLQVRFSSKPSCSPRAPPSPTDP